MATMTLSTIGSIFLGPIGGAAGAALGSYLDSKYIMPALFPSDAVSGPRLGDLKISAAQEGDPAAICYGEGARVAGTVTYAGDLIEEKHEERHGKGGTVVTYDYFVNCDVAFCLNTVEEIDEIFADGKTLWKRQETLTINYNSPSGTPTDLMLVLVHEKQFSFLDPFVATISDTSIALGDTSIHLSSLDRTGFADNEIFTVAGDTTEYVVTGFTSTGAGTGTVTFRPVAEVAWANGSSVTFTAIEATDTFGRIDSPVGGPDLSQFPSGADLSVTGWPKAQNNGSYRVVASQINQDGTSWVKLRNENARNDDQTTTITLTYETPAFNSGNMDSINIHIGLQQQHPDTLLESLLGEGNVPAYRGETHAVIGRLHIGAFGNRMPNFEAKIRERTGRLVAEVLEFLLLRAGYDPTEFDTSGVIG